MTSPKTSELENEQGRTELWNSISRMESLGSLLKDLC